MQTHNHVKFNGPLLDNLLEQGYYRMRQEIFTTDFIIHNENIYHVYWLRFRLADFQLTTEAQKLLNTKKDFTVSFTPFQLTDELIALYKRYLSNVNFDAPPTIQDFLFGEDTKNAKRKNLFESVKIELRHNDQLIAAGIFDKGLTSLAGIMNFYDPAYKKYSLGKLLMLLKMQYAIEQKMEYYYPGYIAYNYPKFDYKLFPNASFAEVYDSGKRLWYPYSNKLLQLLSARYTQ